MLKVAVYLKYIKKKTFSLKIKKCSDNALYYYDFLNFFFFFVNKICFKK